MKLFKSKKAIVLLGAMVVAVAASIGAYAYFTSTGTGTSTAGTVGIATGWNVAGGSIVGTLYPDADSTGPDLGVVTGASVTNAATSGNQNLHQIVATITGVTQGATVFVGQDPCAASDFQFDSPLASWSGEGTQTATITPNDDLAAGGVYSIGDLNVVLVDNGAKQDNCQGAHVTVTFNAS